MGTSCAPLVADLFLFCYERDFMMSLSDDKQADICARRQQFILKDILLCWRNKFPWALIVLPWLQIYSCFVMKGTL